MRSGYRDGMHTSNARILGSGCLLLLAVTCSLTSCASAPEPEPTVESVDSELMPVSNVNKAMIDCMQEKGWDPQLDWGGALDYGNVPQSQATVLEADSTECIANTGWGDLTRLTADQISILYEREVDTYKCLVGIGESPGEPPTRQSYIDSFGTGEQYHAIREVPAQEEVIQACPPPTWFMNW